MYAAVNRASRSLIRVEADELTYDLHIILRFELEIEPFEEQATDDNSWTDAPYLLDKGFQMYRARLDWQVTEKFGTAVAANYMLLAEDALNGDKDIGYEFDFYSTYETRSEVRL